MESDKLQHVATRYLRIRASEASVFCPLSGCSCCRVRTTGGVGFLAGENQIGLKRMDGWDRTPFVSFLQSFCNEGHGCGMTLVRSLTDTDGQMSQPIESYIHFSFKYTYMFLRYLLFLTKVIYEHPAASVVALRIEHYVSACVSVHSSYDVLRTGLVFLYALDSLH